MTTSKSSEGNDRDVERPLVFCLTPVKNEAWILERFLQCASVWADRIIIADQGSTDGSREIARRFPKVTLIDNPAKTFNEPERQQMLLDAARKTGGPKVLMALDADEFLTANFLTSPEWKSILSAPPGTVISFQWPEIEANASDMTSFYFRGVLPVGFVDDGSEHKGKIIHSYRIPTPPGCLTMIPSQIKLMHYCLFDLERFRSRIRWYQCFEHLTLKKKPMELYRFYHLVLFVSPNVKKPIPTEWIRGYEELGIDMSSIKRDGRYRWDEEVRRYFEQYGVREFRRLDLWDIDWSDMFASIYPDKPAKTFPDPRNWFDKVVHRWLRRTQPDFSLYANPGLGKRLSHKLVQTMLGLIGW